MVGPEAVRFLEVPGPVSDAEDWRNAGRGRLWLYHLHYFDDLTAREFERRRDWHHALLQRWIRENPPGRVDGWDPYPTSLRITNWIKWSLASETVPGDLTVPLADSLAMQARWLSRRLEVHLMGNHLWANAKALMVAGLFFEGPEAAGWLHRGLDVFRGQLDEQILADGGHFERSPMYHGILLEDVLDLIQLSGVFPGVLPPAVTDRLGLVARQMLRWLEVMSHPDGDVSFFNDSAFGMAAPYAALAQHAGALGVKVDGRGLGPIEVLPDSGYLRLQNDRAVVLCDVAPVGPDHQPAHAHADTLSFELSLDGRRVFVNGGTSTYAPGPERTRQRGTAAHNTVEVDNCNSSDVWGGFRVGRRARPFDVRWGTSPQGLWAEGAHDGYQHTRNHVIHRRAWLLDSAGLTVTDSLEGAAGHAVARFIFHPEAAAASPGIIEVRCEPPVATTRRDATWHPRFGRTVPTQALEVALAWPRTVTRMEWA